MLLISPQILGLYSVVVELFNLTFGFSIVIRRIGRKQTILIFTLMAVVPGCLAVVSSHPIAFIVCRFISGVGERGVFQCAYVLRKTFTEM
jgi:MFS family permease